MNLMFSGRRFLRTLGAGARVRVALASGTTTG